MKTLFVIFVLAGIAPLVADDFFTIDAAKLHQVQDSSAPLLKTETYQDANKQPQVRQVFTPYMEVQAEVKSSMDAVGAQWHVYFFDEDRNKLCVLSALATPTSGGVLVPGQKTSALFAVPDSVLAQTEWTAVVVFGDDKGVDVRSFPQMGEESEYSFNESKLFDRNGPPIERKPSLPPLVEREVNTYDSAQPTLTLFLRTPAGVKNMSDTKGTLAMCVLAESVDDIRKELQGQADGFGQGPLVQYADQRKLMILCWGSHRLWDPQKNWDDLDSDAAFSSEQTFNHVADAWERGVASFGKDYGLPQNNYLLWGISGSAQYACRLALRKPQYFLAVHVHIPSSFDKPTSDGRKVLWCLTTGELEAGHARSLRFYAQCKALGYPIIYKAIEGLGHSDSADAQNLGVQFFDYALSVRDLRTQFDTAFDNPLNQFQATQNNSNAAAPWLASFRQPPYIGDIVNQDMVPAEETDMVPDSFRTPLPTKEIAEAWNK